MSVDTRAHIDGYSNVVLRRTNVYAIGADGIYRQRKTLSIDRDGISTYATLEDLGIALRILKITPAELGYKTVGRAPKGES